MLRVSVFQFITIIVRHVETYGSTQEDMGKEVAESTTFRKPVSRNSVLGIQNPQSTPVVSPYL